MHLGQQASASRVGYSSVSCIVVVHLGSVSQSISVTASVDNPAEGLKRYVLSKPVISCASAAAAKGIPLGHELKSLVIEIESGLVVAHIPGDRRLSLRAVKRCLPTAQARLANLDGLDLLPGTVHPFHALLWPLHHLVAHEVLDLGWVSTNAGELTTYVIFDPALLLRARRVSVDDFCIADGA
jgi:prolyl-tRNA editing enzyme YbaK/EbsC (Cys-tRNA(Pro) deacylase)